MLKSSQSLLLVTINIKQVGSNTKKSRIYLVQLCKLLFHDVQGSARFPLNLVYRQTAE